jgi:hypothetical protein
VRGGKTDSGGSRRKKTVTENDFSVGTILYMSLDVNDGIIPKDGFFDRKKYFVVIGFTPEGNAIGALLVNSNINPHVSIRKN